MAKPNCKECPSLDPNNRFDSRYPDYCPFGPAGATKLLDNVCPYSLGVEEIRNRCANFALFPTSATKGGINPESLPCLAGDEWQAKRLDRRTTCIVRKLKDLSLCFGYKSRKS